MTAPRILVVDDEAHIRELIEITMVKMGLDVDCAESLDAARQWLAQREYALVLSDMRLPDGMGIELVREITASGKGTPVAVITAFGSADNAVQALKAGAFDYLSKPVALDQLRQMVQSALRISQNDHQPRQATSSGSKKLRLVGESASMKDLRSQIALLARSMAPVAITGESGTGKELAARDIHALSPRADKPFVAVNCGAIPETLMEAEFFGYRKGAFTGANDDREGFFQAANGGTLMLDEVADLPLQMQVKLLRAIQERRVRKVGATNEESVDVRIISATHQNLAEWVERGKFRQDLYYRLNVIELQLSPLRERMDDVPLLAKVILARLSEVNGVQGQLSVQALDALRQYSFPGNVRELENVLERALAFAENGRIEAVDLRLKGGSLVPEGAGAGNRPVRPDTSGAIGVDSQLGDFADAFAVDTDILPPDAVEPVKKSAMVDGLPTSLPDYLDDIECSMIRLALSKTQFNRTKAADLLGVSFRQLRYRMQRLNIREDE